MGQVRLLWQAIAALVFLTVLTVWVFAYPIADWYSHNFSGSHEQSEVQYGLSAYGTLRGADQIRDSLLCVSKLRSGDFKAIQKGSKDGNTYYVTDDSANHIANCNDVNRNLNGHTIGVNPDGAAGPFWGEHSSHN